jgi:hypothetical protein
LKPLNLASSGGSTLDPQVKEKIDGIINGNKIVLFMKGNALFPQW